MQGVRTRAKACISGLAAVGVPLPRGGHFDAPGRLEGRVGLRRLVDDTGTVGARRARLRDADLVAQCVTSPIQRRLVTGAPVGAIDPRLRRARDGLAESPRAAPG